MRERPPTASLSGRQPSEARHTPAGGALPAAIVRNFLCRTVRRYDRSAPGVAEWRIAPELAAETRASPAEGGLSAAAALASSGGFAQVQRRIEAAWARRAAAVGVGPFDDTLLVALESPLGLVAWGEKRLYWMDNSASYSYYLLSTAQNAAAVARGGGGGAQRGGRPKAERHPPLRMLRYAASDPSSLNLPGAGGCASHHFFALAHFHPFGSSEPHASRISFKCSN